MHLRNQNEYKSGCYFVDDFATQIICRSRSESQSYGWTVGWTLDVGYGAAATDAVTETGSTSPSASYLLNTRNRRRRLRTTPLAADTAACSSAPRRRPPRPAHPTRAAGCRRLVPWSSLPRPAPRPDPPAPPATPPPSFPTLPVASSAAVLSNSHSEPRRAAETPPYKSVHSYGGAAGVEGLLQSPRIRGLPRRRRRRRLRSEATPHPLLLCGCRHHEPEATASGPSSP